MFTADALLKAISQAVFATDASGAIVFSNPAAEKLFGGDRSSIVGRTLAGVMPDHDVSELFAVVREEGTWSGGRRNEDDSLSFITACALRGDDRAIDGFVIVSTPLDSLDLPRVVDESERLRLENRLLQAERISSLGRLAASVAHEFNNVLMGIQPFVDLLTKRAGSDPSVKLAAPRIADAVARGKRITQEILRFTRIGEPTRVPVNVAEWLRAFEPELVQLAGPLVTVSTEADSSLTMLADAHQLRQVFANLVVNAHHAMPNGGKLEIHAAAEAMSDGNAGPIPAIHFSIRDTGVGIPEDTLLYIFEPLFTTKKFGGTGLGLAVASQVVQQHHGHIYAESTLGEGTTSHILIPAAPAASVATEPAVIATRRAARPPMRVTMIEDDESVGAGL